MAESESVPRGAEDRELGGGPEPADVAVQVRHDGLPGPLLLRLRLPIPKKKGHTRRDESAPGIFQKILLKGMSPEMEGVCSYTYLEGS